ncbi:MAG: hypothetical protein HYS25_02315 [Ignavibacteriales bacterium]|nr:hypothetical protein [Ignavibacteriales bacterium]
MKKLSLFLLALLVASCATVYTPEYGKLFTKEEANTLYGKPIESIAMDAKTFRSVLAETKNILMYAIVDGEIILAGEGRKVLYPVGKSIPEKTVLYVASKKVVQELIDKIGATENAQIFIERRSSVISISYENYTLEQGTPCPPNC